jgi:EAL domain-containing protein (putative c-di-GMP-specific phosphodiesterase class I)
MDRSEASRAVVKSIIGLGNSLGVVTVAEGVENFAQLDAMRGFGCAEAQGFYFSPAVVAGEVERAMGDGFEHARDAA